MPLTLKELRDRRLCLRCEEPLSEGGASRSGDTHQECLMRAVLGSLGHQRMRCSCFGGTEEDPPHMTKREAALAAVGYAYVYEWAADTVAIACPGCGMTAIHTAECTHGGPLPREPDE